jgi:hypothetical protein
MVNASVARRSAVIFSPWKNRMLYDGLGGWVTDSAVSGNYGWYTHTGVAK